MSKLWNDTLTHLELKLSPQHFSTWIKPLKLVKIEQDMVYLEVPNRFVLDWVKENYGKLIQKILAELSAVSYRLQFDVVGQARDNLPKRQTIEPVHNAVTTKEKNLPVSNSAENNLNRKYTFEEFVSGSSNQFAYAAAMAVANNPATTYNPLFIYGGVGLGKTHLVNAIGNAILKKTPQTRICYYTSEKFMNELINSLRYNRMDEFRNKFRSIDVLLIDDIQFIAGKERTQEEFFHTFNALYESHKQIIVTSDKFPKDIPGLEERLRSRFEWGLIADIQPPDVET
jgi:chromosomal replication initiator protein